MFEILKPKNQETAIKKASDFISELSKKEFDSAKNSIEEGLSIHKSLLNQDCTEENQQAFEIAIADVLSAKKSLENIRVSFRKPLMDLANIPQNIYNSILKGVEEGFEKPLQDKYKAYSLAVEKRRKELERLQFEAQRKAELEARRLAELEAERLAELEASKDEGEVEVEESLNSFDVEVEKEIFSDPVYEVPEIISPKVKAKFISKIDREAFKISSLSHLDALTILNSLGYDKVCDVVDANAKKGVLFKGLPYVEDMESSIRAKR